MAVDTSPAESARSLLNGIDYGALIGGPLQAAISAQAMAAKSTWEFIQQVGLNTEADGTRSAINISFMYQRDGEMVKLIVPILTIVPIPLIVVDEIAIDFTANINASASSTSEDSKAQDIGGELNASGSIGWGPFSLNASIKASYSSKQSSKATQDSRYSVEYTQTVRVHARQADMPAGLATVLNILSSAATGGTLNGSLTVSPSVATVNTIDPETAQLMQIITKDGNGLNVSAPVKITFNNRFADCFIFSDSVTGEVLPQTTGSATLPISVSADTKKGSLALNISAGSAMAPPGPPRPVLTIAATIKGSRETQEAVMPVSFLQALPSSGLRATPNTIALVGTTPGTVELIGTGAALATATVVVKTNTTGCTTSPATIVLAGNKAQVTITKGVTPVAGEIVFEATDSNQNKFEATLNLGVTIVGRAGMQFSALERPSPIVGLSVEPEASRQTWTVVMEERDDAGTRPPLRVQFDPAIVTVRQDGERVGVGGTLKLNEANAARLEFELAAGVEANETQVVIEAEGGNGLMRQVIPVRIS